MVQNLESGSTLKNGNDSQNSPEDRFLLSRNTHSGDEVNNSSSIPVLPSDQNIPSKNVNYGSQFGHGTISFLPAEPLTLLVESGTSNEGNISGQQSRTSVSGANPSFTPVPSTYYSSGTERANTAVKLKPQTAGSRIFGKFASQDYHVMRSNIILFPLSFVNSRDELRFYNRIVQTFQIRARIAAFASFIMFLVYWICTAVSLAQGTFPSSGPLAQLLYSICMALVMLASVIPYVASTTAALKKYIEVLLYVSVLVTALVIGGWIVINAILDFSSKFQRTKIWLNVYIYIVPFWSCMLMDIVMQARTKTSFTIHVANFAIFSTANIVQTAIFVQKGYKSFSGQRDQSSFMIVSTLLDCFFGLTINVLLFMGRWFLELQERVEFLRRMRATDQIRRIKDSSSKKKRKKGATVVEDVMTLVEKVIHNIKEVLIESNLPSLAEGGELLKQCQEILTDTDNLYTVRYQTKGLGEEEEALEEQFLQIYADRQYCRLPTRVRFGEVTGIQFDAEAATRDISKSGQLEKPGTLRSFGLLHLHDPLKKHLGIPELAPPLLMDKADAVRIGRDWEMDILQLAKTYPNILLEVGAVLLCEKLEAIRATPTCLLNFLFKLQSCYPENPYHNRMHGAAVAHATSCLMRMLYVYEAVDHSNMNDISVLIAALGHDAGHPARNNQFFVNRSDNLALLYNDASVLENVHSAITFKCLETAGANIFADVTPEIFRTVRKRVIELILTTDMGQHFESVSRFRLRRQASGFNYLQDADDMWLVIRMCIKCADLSHALVDWPQHLDWSLRVVEEFYQQGEDEVQLGLKVSPLCDRGSHADFAKSQKGFIEFVVQPLITQMEELEHGAVIGTDCVKQLMVNKSKWEEWATQQYSPPIPEEYRRMKTDSFITVQTLISLYIKGQKLVPLQSVIPNEQEDGERNIPQDEQVLTDDIIQQPATLQLTDSSLITKSASNEGSVDPSLSQHTLN